MSDETKGAILGIDPGKTGSIAVLFKPTDTVEIHPMPKDACALCELLNKIVNQVGGHTYVTAVLEKVGGYINGAPNTGSSMFSFGYNVGVLHGVLAVLNISFIEVAPAKWMTYVGAGKRGDRSKADWKLHLADMARKSYPGLKVTRQNADALLILAYARSR